MGDPTIRTMNVAVLLKLQTAEGVPAVPDAAVDAIPVEADSISYNNPWTMEASNEATGSQVMGAPLIIGQAATFSFKSRIKGAGAGVAYSPTVKPPLHAAFQIAGWRGQFTAAIAAALAAGGSATTITLPGTFPATARALLGMQLLIGAGTGAGNAPAVIEYAANVATLSERFAPALDATSSVSLPASWTYAGTTPQDAAARITDNPMATIYFYEDGVLRMFTDCRATLMLDGKSARPGYGTWNCTGVYAGKVDAPIPANIAIAGHSAPVLVQGASLSPAVSINRKPLAVSTWSLDPGSTLEVPEDPNTQQGFAGGQIVDRTPMLKIDPLATLVANRDTVAEIGAGVTMPGVFRHGSQSGNRWALVLPLAQPVSADPTARGKLRAEDIGLQARSLGRDAYGRDTDRVIVFN